MHTIEQKKAGNRQRLPAFLFSLSLPVLLITFACLITPHNACADPPVHINQKKVTLDKITPREIGLPVQGNLAISEGSIDFDLNGDGSVRNGEEIGIDESHTGSGIIRRIDQLWRWTVLKKEERPYIKAEYTVTGLNGQHDVLSLENDPSQTITVRVQSLPLAWEEKNNQWICTGSVDLVMELSDIAKSGNFEGTITTLISIVSF